MHVVLVEPQIPANTGNIARLCAVSGCSLHLIRPLGFFLDNRHLKRAGLDYWTFVDVNIHDHWEAFWSRRPETSGFFFIETGSEQYYTDVHYGADDYLVFGSETEGLTAAVLAAGLGLHVSVPMLRGRSLNLANTAAIVVYEAWRQQGFATPGGENP